MRAEADPMVLQQLCVVSVESEQKVTLVPCQWQPQSVSMSASMNVFAVTPTMAPGSMTERMNHMLPVLVLSRDQVVF